MRWLALLCAVFAFPLFAQDGGAQFVGMFGGGSLPMRDLAIHCQGSNIHLYGDTYHGDQWQPNAGAQFANGHLTALNNDAALWVPDADAALSVPSGCTEYGGALYSWYTDAVTNTGNDFQAVSAGVVVSADGGASWVKHRLTEGDGAFAQATFAIAGDGYVYALFTGAGRVGGVSIARTSDLTRLEAYTWFDGQSWGGVENAVTIINGEVGEATICHDGTQWRIAYLDPTYNGIVLRTAPALTGVWSEARVIVDLAVHHGQYAPQFIGCNGAFLLSSFEPLVVDGLTYPAYSVYEWSL